MSYLHKNTTASASKEFIRDPEEQYQQRNTVQRKIDVPKRGRGRPPKNMTQKAHKVPVKEAERVVVQQNSTDGFNVRKQAQTPSYIIETKSEEIKITGLFTDKNTNEIFYKVEENKTCAYRSRKWVLNRSKRALIEFYQSCVKIKA